MLKRSLPWVAAACFACGDASPPAPPQHPAPVASSPAPAAKTLAQVRDAYLAAHHAAWPVQAAKSGLHEHDGKLPDVTAPAIEKEIARLDAAIIELEGIGAATPAEQLDRAILIAQARRQRFALRDWKLLDKQPLVYLFAILGGPNLLMYVDRPYASEAERAKGLAGVCRAFPSFYAEAKKKLPEQIPGTWLMMSKMVGGGLLKLVANAPKAFPNLEAGARADLDEALGQCTSALTDFLAFLQTRKSSNDFRLGEALYLRMLKENEGLDVTVARLREVAEADLERNRAAVAEAANKIDPKRPVADVVAEVIADKPAADAVLKIATEQAVQQRQFLIDRKIVSIPSSDVAEVKVTPPFMRFNFAFLNSAGPFEQKALPSYYYITPPDPAWPEDKQRGYLPSRHFLFYVTAHEVWPGHFLHHLHQKKSASVASKHFCSYAMSEGWAHYTEEMMWAEGAGGDDAKNHIGQLQGALVRNVRFMASLGFHTGDLTVPEAKQMFVEQAFRDEGNAMQQAVRGTMDPGYLSYTLGKLMIMKLRKDWMASNPGATLQQFHDTFLSYQCANIPDIRRFMLGENAGPAL